MPFIAIDKNTDERIDILEFENPKKELAEKKKRRELLCQICKNPMYPRHTLTVTQHFAHYPDTERDCLSGGESEVHRTAKRTLANRLSGPGKRYRAIYEGADIEYEVFIPEIKRIADILVTFPDGTKEAHEIQLSHITGYDLERRTEDYLSVGIDIIWWLGPNANTEANRNWLIEKYGYFATVKPEAVQVV